MSMAGVSFARVMTAEIDLRSVVPRADGGSILTASATRLEGRIALIAAGDVPGGSDDSRNVGFGTLLS